MKRRLVQEFYRFLQLLTTSYKFFHHLHFEQCSAAPFDNIEEVVDEGVAEDLNDDPDQGVFASHLAQGGITHTK